MKIIDKKLLRIEKTDSGVELINLRELIGSRPAIIASCVIYNTDSGFPCLLLNGSHVPLQFTQKFRAPVWYWIQPGDRIELKTGPTLLEFEIYYTTQIIHEIEIGGYRFGFLSQRRIAIGLSILQYDRFVSVSVNTPSVLCISIVPYANWNSLYFLDIESGQNRWTIQLLHDTTGNFTFVIPANDTVKFSCRQLDGTDLSIGLYITIFEQIWWKNQIQQLPKTAKKTAVISREIELRYPQSQFQIDLSNPIEYFPWIPECATVLLDFPCTLRRVWIFGSCSNPAIFYLNEQSIAGYKTPMNATEFNFDIRIGPNDRLQFVTWRYLGQRIDDKIFVVLEVEL